MKESRFFEAYKHPKWQKMRSFILERDEYTCQHCLDKDEQLHVHHQYYVKGRKPWEYPGFCYKTLCKSCHDLVKDGPNEYVMPWELIVEELLSDGSGSGFARAREVMRLSSVPEHSNFNKYIKMRGEVVDGMIESDRATQ